MRFNTLSGSPSRIIAAWASGCRKFSVIANSATASPRLRNGESVRVDVMRAL